MHLRKIPESVALVTTRLGDELHWLTEVRYRVDLRLMQTRTAQSLGSSLSREAAEKNHRPMGPDECDGHPQPTKRCGAGNDVQIQAHLTERLGQGPHVTRFEPAVRCRACAHTRHHYL